MLSKLFGTVSARSGTLAKCSGIVATSGRIGVQVGAEIRNQTRRPSDPPREIHGHEPDVYVVTLLKQKKPAIEITVVRDERRIPHGRGA